MNHCDLSRYIELVSILQIPIRWNVWNSARPSNLVRIFKRIEPGGVLPYSSSSAKTLSWVMGCWGSMREWWKNHLQRCATWAWVKEPGLTSRRFSSVELSVNHWICLAMFGYNVVYTILTRGYPWCFFALFWYCPILAARNVDPVIAGAPSVHAMAAAQANVNDYRRSESSQLLMHWDDRGLYEDHGMTSGCFNQWEVLGCASQAS